MTIICLIVISGRPDLKWIDSIFSYMRRAQYTGKKNYFKGSWPNEEWAEE